MRAKRPRTFLRFFRLRHFRRLFLRQFPRRKTMTGGFLHRLLGEGLFDHRLWKPERQTLASGMAIGIFVGLMPTYWVQIVIAVILAYILKVNITASVLGTAITNPFTTIPIVSLQYKFGFWLIGPGGPHNLDKYPEWIKLALKHGMPYLVGCSITAIVGAILGYLAVILFWNAGTKVNEARHHHK